MGIIQLQGITKRFGELVANDQIDLTINKQEIIALLGENGAGKTTLTKILYGMYQPDEGDILVDGVATRFNSPADAIDNGVGFVSQHFSLVPTFTVAENVVLGREGGRILSHKEMERLTAETAERNGFTIDPSALVRDLSVGEQQRVEILKALYRDCRVLILDEPTAVLTPHDIDSLFKILNDLREKHLSVIIITHKLDEAMAISQRVVVLRLGKVVGKVNTAETNKTALAQMMVGRETVVVARNTEREASKEVVLSVKDLQVTDKRGVETLRGVSLDLHAGEIVGVAGVAGNGQSELVSILNGMLVPNKGSIQLGQDTLPLGDPRVFYERKIGRIPEDRLKGIIGDLTVAQNLALERINDFATSGHLRHKQIKANAEQLIKDFQIKATPDDRARTLSGGNIQKIILARTLSQQPVAVIASQPTRGLDIGATEYVHQKLLEQKEQGTGILLISEDLDEVLILSDRILVMYDGEIVGEMRADQANIDQISLLMAGSKTG